MFLLVRGEDGKKMKKKKMKRSKCGQYLMGIRCGSRALDKCWGVNMIMGSSVLSLFYCLL